MSLGPGTHFEPGAESIESVLGHVIYYFGTFSDGFSFVTETELQAYKAAYLYRYCKKIVVSEAPNIGAWRVSITTGGRAGNDQLCHR